ncbi:MAG: hypothetical protein SF187_17210 [Deltaproteobacteria bacterium]|nr:hypothetical protein [Deltaproteobacteria bacterium]
MVNFVRGLSVVVVSLGVAAAFVACDDDDGKGTKTTGADAAADAAPDAPPDAGFGGTFSTNVTPSKPLNQLTPQEAQKVCEATTTYVGKGLQDATFTDLVCRIAGLVSVLNVPDAEVQATCTKAYNACKAAPAPMELPTGACGETQTTQCTATVAEYEACVNELPSDLKAINAVVASCDRATKNSVVALVAIPSLLGPACTALNKKCPSEFNGLTNLGGMLPGGFGGR